MKRISIQCLLIYCCSLHLLAAEKWLNVPFVKQPKNGCGAASISMVLQYWNNNRNSVSTDAMDVERILEQLYVKQSGGIPGSGMRKYFEGLNFQTFVFQAEWSDLTNHLSKGRPLIVCLKSNSSEAANHFVVVGGIDDSQNILWINDPAGRKLQKMARQQFETEWHLTNNWTLLALPSK